MKYKSWQLDNAEELAEAFPYTFYKPSAEVISLLKIGNQVKLIFRFDSDAPEAPGAERMWVEITEIHDGSFRGQLNNDPRYITDLQFQDVIEFQACHIVNTDLDDPVPSITEQYIKRCFVTNNILYEGQKVGYLYREKPDCEDDSGWRFTTGKETDEYMDNTDNISYVSLGAVLQEDDSFVQLLDREAGVAFAKEENGDFVELD